MFTKFVSAFLLIASIAAGASVHAQELTWPRDLDIQSGVLTMYQPEVDTLEGDVLSFRAAVSYKDDKGSEPVFGAAWFESRVEIDRDTRNVHMVDLKVTDTRFPEGSEHVQGELAQYIREGLPTWDVDFSLDGLLTSLEASEQEIAAASNLKMDPPEIIYRDHPALLISIDGEPVLREIENTNFQAVVNTPYPMIYDGKRYYLNAAKDVWYRAQKAEGPWQFDPKPPSNITSLVNQEESEDGADESGDEVVTAENAPEIVVSIEPSELIVSEGKPDFEPLVDDLLVLKNSQDDIFMHVSAQNYYVVLSGRWFHAKSLNGPWAYVASDKLPAAFNDIPADSPQADSRVYVAGTDEAREAVMDAQIPQTAAVQKGTVQLDVTYDGDPKFESIEGTALTYAVNTGSTVLKSGGSYFLVEDAVWYTSSSATGPWTVAESRPEGVEAIPPENPVYNVKYVYIYETTPEVVYVGYTPGYTGSYVYNTTIVYGTGWYYRPWISPYYYYPRYGTWGFNIRYNPWTGWNFGLSWGWGPFRVGFYSGGLWHRHHYWGRGHYGRWGPGGYRPRPVHFGNNNININNNINVNRGNIKDNNLYRDKGQKANVAQTRDFRAQGQENRNRVSSSDRAGATRPSTRPDTGKIQASDLSRPSAADRQARPSTAQNNVFTDKSGNVYRQTDGGWQKNDGKSWSNVPSTGARDTSRSSSGAEKSRPSTASGTSAYTNRSTSQQTSRNTRNSSAYRQSGSGYNNRSSLDRQSYSRQRSSARSSQYSSHRSRGGGSRRR